MWRIELYFEHVGLEMPVRQARADAERASKLHDSGALGRGQASPSKEITIFGNASASVCLIPLQGEPDQCQPRKIGTA